MQRTAFRDNSPPCENPRRMTSRKPTFNIIRKTKGVLLSEKDIVEKKLFRGKKSI